jgi:hypothetical protein
MTVHIEVSRPFRLGGYATGDYLCTCLGCGGGFVGDKRALSCLPCAVERVEAAISSIPSPDDGAPMRHEGGDGWRPIETAPKDGTEVWLFGTSESSPFSRPHIGCEDREVAYWHAGGWKSAWCDGWVVEPSHWQPLPAPPSRTPLNVGEGSQEAKEPLPPTIQGDRVDGR